MTTTTVATPQSSTSEPQQVREMTADEIAAASGAGIHWGNSALGFSLTKDGLTVCAAGSCGTIWWDALTKQK